MKQTLLILILILVFAAGCACPWTGSAPEPGISDGPVVDPVYAGRLAREYCPVIHFYNDGMVEETYQPETVDIMVDNAVLLNAEDATFYEKVTLPDLQQWSGCAHYLDLAGLEPDAHSLDDYRRDYDRVKQLYPPTVYARVSEGAGGYTVVQYWLFYYFNDWRNLHEGDWELVQLCFPGYTSRELIEGGVAPVMAAYSQHQAGQKMPWGEMESRGLVEGTHPLVYVSRGSHANYFTPGDYWSGLDFDNTGYSSWEVLTPEQLDVVLLPEVGAAGAGYEWIAFKGGWGECTNMSVSVLELRFEQRGPTGPPWGGEGKESYRWRYPGEWADELPEYPQPFWNAFIKIPGGWFDQGFFCLFSPANIHVYDARGRHVGPDAAGEIEIQIPGAVYITPEGTQYKTIILPDADVSQEYRLITDGTGAGNMELKIQVPDARNKVRQYLEYTNVPVSAVSTARVRIIPEKTARLELDGDGDGIYEIEVAPGDFRQQKAEPAVVAAGIVIEPAEFDLTRVAEGEVVTAYIELPVEYNAGDIDVGTIRLLGNITVLEKSAAVADYDRDGVYELAVRFDRRLVAKYILGTGQTDGKVTLILTGIVDGRSFRGSVEYLVVPAVKPPGQ